MFREWISLLLSYPPWLQTATQEVESLPMSRAFLDQGVVFNERRRLTPPWFGSTTLRTTVLPSRLGPDRSSTPYRLHAAGARPFRLRSTRIGTHP